MGPNGLYELIYLDDIVYKGWISYRFTYVHKSVLISTQGYIGISEQYL